MYDLPRFPDIQQSLSPLPQQIQTVLVLDRSRLVPVLLLFFISCGLDNLLSLICVHEVSVFTHLREIIVTQVFTVHSCHASQVSVLQPC